MSSLMEKTFSLRQVFASADCQCFCPWRSYPFMYNYTKSPQTTARIKTCVFVPVGLINLKWLHKSLARLFHFHDLYLHCAKQCLIATWILLVYNLSRVVIFILYTTFFDLTFSVLNCQIQKNLQWMKHQTFKGFSVLFWGWFYRM